MYKYTMSQEELAPDQMDDYTLIGVAQAMHRWSKDYTEQEHITVVKELQLRKLI